MVVEALRAADVLAPLGVEIEIVDCRSIRPFDRDTLLASLAKTGRVIVADTSWVSFGLASEVASVCVEEGFRDLRAPIRRIGLAECPAPVSLALERAFYPDYRTIARECLAVLDRGPELRELEPAEDAAFRGPY